MLEMKRVMSLYRESTGNSGGKRVIDTSDKWLQKEPSLPSFDRGADQTEKTTLPTVQADREIITPNGCRVRVFFKTDHNPMVRKEIARLLLAAFMQERMVDDETSHVLVQGINARAS